MSELGTLVVDARRLRCPLPVIRLAAAARGAVPGTLITVLWTDPAARHDIPAWARMRGHELVGTVVHASTAQGTHTVVEGSGPVGGEPDGSRPAGAPDPEPAFATTVRIA